MRVCAFDGMHPIIKPSEERAVSVMDQIKIGQFIAQKRKELELTQRQLADILGISDKTVSKWERGNGMPEVSLMLPLCRALHINVNELLSGEDVTDANYKQKAEENMMDFAREREESKKKIVLAVVVSAMALLSGVTLVLLAGMLQMEIWLRVLLIAIALIEIACGIGVACALDLSAGTYECRKCGKRFVPTAGAYVKGPHTITTRQLKCPHCGKVSYCKKRLTH